MPAFPSPTRPEGPARGLDRVGAGVLVGILAAYALLGVFLASLVQDAPMTVLSVTKTRGPVWEGDPAALTATVTGTTPDTRVTLQYRTRGGTWVDHGKPMRVHGTQVRLPLPTNWYGSRTWRAHFTFGSPFIHDTATRGLRVRVRPEYMPMGSPKAHRGILKTMVARWDPCAGPITYRVNTTQAGYAEALQDVRAAFREVAHGTGLRFQYVGEAAPTSSWLNVIDRETDIVIRWAKGPDPLGMTSDRKWESSLGVTRPYGEMGWKDPQGHPVARLLHAEIWMNGRHTKWMQETGVPGVEQIVLMHEIGHAVGLGHVHNATQIMNTKPVKEWGLQGWGAGDLRGLERVGAGHGCLRVDVSWAGAKHILFDRM